MAQESIAPQNVTAAMKTPLADPLADVSRPGPQPLPDWYPAWARSLAELYYSGTTCLFVLHGNVHDLIRCPSGDGAETYCNLPEFLAGQIFGSWDVAVQFDLARGLRAASAGDGERLQRIMKHLTS